MHDKNYGDLLNIFHHYMKIHKDFSFDHYVPLLIKNLHTFLSTSQKIRFVIPAFAGKSKNSNSVFGTHPDMAEFVALQQLKNFLVDINNVYHAGAELTIVQDAHFFYPLGITADIKIIDEYWENLQKMNSSTSIKFMNIYDIYKNPNIDHCFENFHNYCQENLISSQEYSFEKKLRGNIAAFISHEFLDNTEMPRNTRNKKAKDIAENYIKRNMALSTLIKHIFKHYFRLSCINHPPITQKIGIKLIPGKNYHKMPWYGALVKYKFSYDIIRKSEGISHGFQIINDEVYGHYFLAADEKGI